MRSVNDRPRVGLALLPTPLMEAPRLTAALGGPRLWVKRDDLTGFACGGNKVRGLEFLLADALAHRADTLVTGAGTQSNHVRATAAAAARAGLAMVAVYFGHPPARVDGNYRLVRLFGAEVRFTGDQDRASVDQGIAAAALELRAAGRNPYEIPRGGASPVGVFGYIRAARELAEQCATLGLNPAAVVVASGSCGTQAGLVVGLRSLGLPWAVEGFTVSRPADEARARVLAFARQAGEELGLTDIVSAEDVVVRDGVIGGGYGEPTREGTAAIRLAAQCEGIVLDPTYTGKAFAGLIDLIRARRFQRDQTVIFLHTGGEPALFAGDGGWLLG